ncbi:unnamed protein product [Arctogadus glacialis]
MDISLHQTRLYRQRNSSLYFLSVRNYDEGVYTCEATNILGQDRQTATIRVTVMPVIVGFSGQVSSRLGAPVELPCRAVGVLPITYTWTRDNTTGPHTSTTTTTITDGDYYCRAENQAGSDRIHTVLLITGI